MMGQPPPSLPWGEDKYSTCAAALELRHHRARHGHRRGLVGGVVGEVRTPRHRRSRRARHVSRRTIHGIGALVLVRHSADPTASRLSSSCMAPDVCNPCDPPLSPSLSLSARSRTSHAPTHCHAQQPSSTPWPIRSKNGNEQEPPTYCCCCLFSLSHNLIRSTAVISHTEVMYISTLCRYPWCLAVLSEGEDGGSVCSCL